MKKKIAKKKVIVSIVIFVLVSGILGGVIFYLYTMQVKAKQKHDWLKNDIRSKQSEIQSLGDQAIKFAEAIAVWESLDEGAKELSGIRISPAKAVLDELEREYRLSDFKLTFSKPELVNTEEMPDLQSENLEIYSSNVAMDFSTVTDEVAFNFVGELMDRYPGYIHINSLSVDRESDITKEHIEMIASGQYPSLVNVKVRFKWKDIKYVPPEEGEGNENMENG